MFIKLNYHYLSCDQWNITMPPMKRRQNDKNGYKVSVAMVPLAAKLAACKRRKTKEDSFDLSLYLEDICEDS